MTRPLGTRTTGGAPANEITMRICELLESKGGQPVEREWLIREAGKAVPPGVAMRRAEQARSNNRHAGAVAPAERKRPASESQLLQYGRRGVVVERLVTMKRHLQDRTDEDGTRWVRLVSLPPAVARDRARARAHFHFDPVELADELRDGADARALLGELTPAQLLELGLELARRERERAR